MYCLRILGLLGILLALACSRSGREEASRPQDLIIGRWESDNAGIEFTPSGSILQLGQKVVVQYRFLDDRTIEAKSGEQHLQLTGVSVSRDDLSLTMNGKFEKFKRVKDFSARLLARQAKEDTPAPPRPTGPEKAEGPIIQGKTTDRPIELDATKYGSKKEPDREQGPKEPLPLPGKKSSR
jgi:hypothetical protein